ncbi:hypothetical protein IB254_18325 [Pseudomonas sp. PDM03]|uniref:hypothetical protein n=1 Tax=Pseudomonas sp. PDM03 TaxID=2769266 RepID=UPI001781780B|nr:hypothetical protein [Pseudomonas sp. PDM03]MBD9589033.1 hypothetical protein [Pseudomonas sp. PDM03]
MSELDLNTSAMGRRELLQAFALLSLGGMTFGLPSLLASPSSEKSGFVVVNGWVLPAHYFRQTRT